MMHVHLNVQTLGLFGVQIEIFVIRLLLDGRGYRYPAFQRCEITGLVPLLKYARLYCLGQIEPSQLAGLAVGQLTTQAAKRLDCNVQGLTKDG